MALIGLPSPPRMLRRVMPASGLRSSGLLKKSLRLGSKVVGVIFCGWMRRVFEVLA